jgi:two-component system sensor histidine kinase KdpD
MRAVRLPRSGPVRRLVDAAIALAAVGAVSVLLVALDVDQTVAALSLVVLGVFLTFVGATAAVVSILASFVALHYLFTEPRGEFGLGNFDDLVALAALGITTGVLGATLTRLNRLRTQSERRDQESRARLELANRLAEGDDPGPVLRDAERVLVSLFGLTTCELQLDEHGHLDVHIEEGPRPVTAADRTEIAAFVLGLRTSLERMHLSAEVADARVEAAVEQSRAGFLSAMTHNLRTPLATIRTALSGLRHTDTAIAPDARADLLDTAFRETDRLERLVTKVLELSRIRSGALVPRPEPVDLAEATQTAVQHLRLLAADREIVLDAAPGLPLVEVDPTLLDVVLVNVLENALRYAPGSPVEVVGRSRDGRVEISVVDHGPGIGDADRSRAFDEFVRLGANGTTPPGTGIGLTIARAFLEAQHGTIALEDTPGGGTTVALSLPISGCTSA